MSELKIEYNTAEYGCGGGMITYDDCTVTMTGGEIGYNTANSYGGGVCNSGDFIMSGGTICGNAVEDEWGYGGGVENSGTFTMSGGTKWRRRE